MPRKPRFQLPGYPQQIVQRGNNRQACFLAEQDYHDYLDAIADACAHCEYVSQAKEAEQRVNAYRELFRYQLDPGMIDEKRKALDHELARCRVG